MFEKIKHLLRIGDLWKRVALLESKLAFLRDKVEEINNDIEKLDDVYATKKHETFLESKIDLLKKRTEDIDSEVKALGKKSISQTTLEEDKPLSTRDIVNEWLNGKEEDSGT